MRRGYQLRVAYCDIATSCVIGMTLITRSTVALLIKACFSYDTILTIVLGPVIYRLGGQRIFVVSI